MRIAGRAWSMKQTTIRPAHDLTKPALLGILTGLIFILDSLSPRGIPVWVLYIIPLVLTYHLPFSRLPLILAAGCSGLTILAYFITPDLAGLPGWIPLLNRSISIVIFSVLAYLVMQQRRMTHDLIKAATLEVEHEALQIRERLLAKSAEELQDLYDHAPCGYHSLDPDGLILAINQTELDWLGYKRHELVGKKRFGELLTSNAVALFKERFPRFIEEGRVSDLELEIVRKDGSTFTVSLSGTALTDPQGRFVASRSTLVDITERKRADHALRMSHQALEALVGERTAALQRANQRLGAELAQSKRVQAALSVSEGRFRDLVECLPEPIWTCLPGGECDYLSPQWVSYTGVPANEQLGNEWIQQLHPQDRRMTIERWQLAVQRAQPFDAEFRIRRADGAYRWFHARATPLQDSEGQVLKWVGTHTDIHDRRQAEAVQARLAAIVESSADAVISKSLEGRVLSWNKSAELMFGYSSDEVLGQPISLIIPPDRRQEESELMEHIKAGKRIQEYETVRRHKDGDSRQVSLTVSPILDARANVTAISTIARDITARKLAEQTLEQQRKLIELSYEPIFAWDIRTGIVKWNRGCEQLYGYSRSDALGQMSHLLLKTEFPCPLANIHAELEATGEWTGEVHHRTKDGREVLVESRLGLLRTDGRSLVLETNRDITDQRQSEIMILKKNKDLETLLYVTSHDLKEPLRAIESFSLLLQERYANRLDPKGQDFLRRIVRATQRLDQLLTDILNLSRAQRMDSPDDDIDADQLVHEVLRRLESRIKETAAKITVRSPLPRLRVNQTWAIQGIYNLVTNALKFVPAGQSPDIEIAPYSETDLEGADLRGLIVQDRGPGVAPEQRDRIFELFRRAVGREVEGTGAGLAIVRQVAERHGGRVWVAPREGGGSNFFITFGPKHPVASEVRP
jgi:PAS domain S-box-containing protein